MSEDLVEITYLGQSTFVFTTPESKTVIVDPWTIHNPLCPQEHRYPGPVDLVLITHGMPDFSPRRRLPGPNRWR